MCCTPGCEQSIPHSNRVEDTRCDAGRRLLPPNADKICHVATFVSNADQLVSVYVSVFWAQRDQLRLGPKIAPHMTSGQTSKKIRVEISRGFC